MLAYTPCGARAGVYGHGVIVTDGRMVEVEKDNGFTRSALGSFLS